MGLEDIKASINKKFKTDMIGNGELSTNFDRIPFTSPRLNYLTRGGIPWPGATELSGPESSGKTTLLGDLTKNAQRMGLICAFTDTENKSQSLDSLILTSTGYKRMGDMQVGEHIYGEDGKLHSIIGVYPQGVKDVYKINFSDGTSTECCGEHLWTVQHLYDRQYMLTNNKPEDYNYQVLRLEQIMSKGLKLYGKTSKKGSNAYYVPVNKAIQFNSENELLLDPYLLGVLIGDGGIADSVGLTSEDIDLIEKVSTIVEDYGCKLVYKSKYDWSIQINNNLTHHPIKFILKQLNLYGCRSWEKFIPKDYLFATIEARIELLRGLIDTDGFVKGVQSYHYSTTSKQLSEDVAFLARSLGCVVVEHERPSYYKNGAGEKIDCRNKYELHINTPDSLIPFSTNKRMNQYTRSLLKPRQRKGHFLKKSIESVELIGKKECQCIRTDNPTGLYITDDFIVTHNTDLDYWKWLGVDLDNLLISKPVNASGETILELQFELMRQGASFLGLDSVASLVPKQVLEGSMSDKTYAGSSGILSTFSQKMLGTGILVDRKICMVGINQVRDVMSGYGYKTPGGHFWKHACVCRLQLSKGNPFNQNYVEMAMSTIEQPAGHWIEVRMLKNQFSKNDRRYTTVTFNYDTGIDIYEDIIEVALDLDIIYRGGAWYKFSNRDTGEILQVNGQEVNLQGKNKVKEYLMENPRIFKWLLGQVNQYVVL